MEKNERPKVLVIAGYDQSGGAGVLADIKTLEANGVYGYAVCTALTFQNERRISRVEWLPEKDVFGQIDLCFETARFDWVKIGVTASMAGAAAIIGHVKRLHAGVRIVLDPVIRASSGREFWAGVAGKDGGAGDVQAGKDEVEGEGGQAGKDGAVGKGGYVGEEEWEAVASQCYVLTPNWEEIGWLYPGADVQERCRALSRRGCSLYLKGGHHPEYPGRDFLWSNGAVQTLDPVDYGGVVYPKHGSGCVLASALTANLALGYPLPVAAARAKRYTGYFLTSNKTLLGWHRPLEGPE